MTITEGITEKVEISLKLNKTFHFIRKSFRVSSKIAEISIHSYTHMFKSRWLVLLIRRDLFQWISSIY